MATPFAEVAGLVVWSVVSCVRSFDGKCRGMDLLGVDAQAPGAFAGGLWHLEGVA